MADFMQQVVAGLASGSIYASLALALVLIHRATGVINFAQGEMATFSTYIAWTLTANHGWNYWPAFAFTLILSFLGGAAIHQGVIRPNEKGSVLRVVIVTIGLLLAINGLVTLIWGGEVRAVQSPFPTRTIDIAGVAVSIQDIGTIAVVLATVLVLWLMFQYTKIGLAMRAAAVNPAEARLVGVRVTWMLSLGWGLAAVLGAVAGMLAAPSIFLDPNLMAALLIYAFAAAVLGGIDSPIGAVVGRSHARRRTQPARHVRRLRRRRPEAPRGAARDPRRPPRQAVGDLRQERGEARMRLPKGLAPVVAFVVLGVVVAVLPSFVSAFRAQQLAYVAIYLTALIGLNILTGYTGQISLGHGAFMAIGGYTTAILMADHGVKDVWTIPIAALVTGVVGFLFGFPALRLSGLYLALATFAIAVSMPAVIKRFEGFTGGGSGINLFGMPGADRVAHAGHRPRPRAELQRLALLPLLDRGARGLRHRVAPAAGAHGSRPAGRARQRDRGAVLGGQPREVQDPRLWRQRRLRRRRRVAVRDRDDLRQPGHVPDRAVDPAPRRRRHRRARLARRV